MKGVGQMHNWQSVGSAGQKPFGVRGICVAADQVGYIHSERIPGSILDLVHCVQSKCFIQAVPRAVAFFSTAVIRPVACLE